MISFCFVCSKVATVQAQDIVASSPVVNNTVLDEKFCEQMHSKPAEKYNKQDYITVFKCFREFELLGGSLTLVPNTEMKVGRLTSSLPIHKYAALNEMLVVCMYSMDKDNSCILDPDTDSSIRVLAQHLGMYYLKFNEFPAEYISGLNTIYKEKMATKDDKWDSPFIALALMHAYKRVWVQADKYIKEYERIVENENVPDILSENKEQVKEAIQWLKYIVKMRDIKKKLPGEAEYKKGVALFDEDGNVKDKNKALLLFKQSFKQKYFRSAEPIIDMMKAELAEALLVKDVTIYGPHESKAWGLQIYADDGWNSAPQYARKEYFIKIMHILKKYELPIEAIEVASWGSRGNVVYSKKPWGVMTFGGPYIRPY